MPLSPTKLADQLATVVPVASEPEAIANLAAAWENYFVDASVLGAPTAPGTLAPATAAFRAAAVGMSAPGAGVAKLQAALAAFWLAVETAAPAIWSGAVAGNPPPGIPALPGALAAPLANNLATNADLKTAANAIAAVLHLQAGLTGTVTVATVSTPIL